MAFTLAAQDVEGPIRAKLEDWEDALTSAVKSIIEAEVQKVTNPTDNKGFVKALALMNWGKSSISTFGPGTGLATRVAAPEFAIPLALMGKVSEAMRWDGGEGARVKLIERDYDAMMEDFLAGSAPTRTGSGAGSTSTFPGRRRRRAAHAGRERSALDSAGRRRTRSATSSRTSGATRSPRARSSSGRTATHKPTASWSAFRCRARRRGFRCPRSATRSMRCSRRCGSRRRSTRPRARCRAASSSWSRPTRTISRGADRCDSASTPPRSPPRLPRIASIATDP